VAVDQEKTDQNPDMLYGEAQYEDGGHNEENDAFAHGCYGCSGVSCGGIWLGGGRDQAVGKGVSRRSTEIRWRWMRVFVKQTWSVVAVSGRQTAWEEEEEEEVV
jgi:hypothetical protein